MNTQVKSIQTETIIGNITRAIQGKGILSLHNASYETGLLGFSVYYAFLARYTNDDKYIAESEAYFNKGMSALDIHNFKRVYSTDSIDAHLSHIGRFILYTKKYNLLEIDADEYLLKLDDILFDLMKSKISIKDFDSASGAMASGYYFLSRMEGGFPVEKQLEFLIHSLANFAEKDKDGDYYWKSPSLYDRVYLSISHGSSLVISFLSMAYEYNVARESCKRIMEKAVNFLLKQYRKSKYKGLFPNMIGDKMEPMQFALCYGDLGTGYALYKAAQVLSEDRVKIFSELVLDDCLLRTKEDNLTLDASIFYGASGLITSFHKLASISGDQRFAERAKYWYGQIPKYMIHENDFAGFQSRLDGSNMLWNVSFGWGILGVGTTLMAYSDKGLPPIAELTFIA